MKLVMFCISFLMVTTVAQASQYTCKDMGGGTCAVNKSTGQCTHSWSNDDGEDSMYFCKKFIGEVKSHYNTANYTCAKVTNGVCAKSISSGQCTHVWKKKDGGDPLFFCKQHLGLASTAKTDSYVCKKTTNGYCAQSVKTGQCTHQWKSKDGGDPLFFCNKFVGK